MTAARTFRVSPHTIRWRCNECRTSGVVPILTGATTRDVQDAIVRSHQRRSDACHAHAEATHVQATQNGQPWPQVIELKAINTVDGHAVGFCTTVDDAR